MIAGSISHNLVCIEVPLGLFISSKFQWSKLGLMIETNSTTSLPDKHSVFHWVFSDHKTQFLFNEGGLSGMTLLSGFATLYYGLPIVKKGNFPIMSAIIDRYLSYMPAIICMTAIDILWPFTGSGPLFQRVAKFVGDKCTKNWWWNIFLVNNWLHPLDIVSFNFFEEIDHFSWKNSLNFNPLVSVRSPNIHIINSCPTIHGFNSNFIFVFEKQKVRKSYYIIFSDSKLLASGICMLDQGSNSNGIRLRCSIRTKNG